MTHIVNTIKHIRLLS